ncbi:hypothetical protein HanPI659440_Chr08g0285431 [Helianthus annuus]|nr:hypothetical protein HanPI659440_Chr08g0285431 [Helianthus annuus]
MVTKANVRSFFKVRFYYFVFCAFLLIPLFFAVGYSLLNVLDPKAAGAMVEAIQEDGKPTWLDQIRPRFLHPTNDSFVAYANVVLGEADEDDSIDPTREEVVVLSSGSSGRSLEDLTSRCARAVPVQGVVNEPVNEPVHDDVEIPTETVGQSGTRKKTKAGASERREKRVEDKVADTPLKRPSTLPVLDYVVVSDTLSGLGVGEKSRGSDPDDHSTLTEMMKKKALEDKKRKLDEQAAALLASKKAKLQKETPPAPSESNIDMGIFSGDRGNLLEEIYAASAPSGVKSGRVPRMVDISKITPPASPPSRTIDLSPPRDDPGKKKREDDVTAEHVGEGGDGGAGGAGGDVAGGAGGGDEGKKVGTEAKSSEATQRRTIYTKRLSGGGGGVALGVARSPQFENIRADSWDTHNPACDDLPHAPRWNLTQRSRMNDLNNCHDFFSLSLPPSERMFQKKRNRFELLDDHVRAGVNYFATSQEIVREWRLMGEEAVEFEDEKRAFAEEKENSMLRRRKQVNAQKQKDWEFACERTNAEMQSRREAIVRLSGEKKEIAEEAQQARVAFEKKEKEYVDRIAKLENLAKQKVSECEAAECLLKEKVSECKASELLVEEVSADCKWLLSRAVPLIADRIVKSRELASYMFELGRPGYNSGRKDGYSEGRAAVVNNEKEYHFELFKEDCGGKYAAKRRNLHLWSLLLLRLLRSYLGRLMVLPY